MKLLARTVSAFFIFITILILLAVIGTTVTKKPLLLTAIRSYSMYPLLERGDAVFIKRVSPGDKINIGDIIVFRAHKGSYASQGLIMHRVVGGNAEEGYITKGDANEEADQKSGGAEPIKPDMIVSKAVTLGGYPLKIPLIGYLPLWMENFKTNPYIMPVSAVIIAVVIGISELLQGKKKRRKKSRLELQMIYFFSGLTITVMLGASMLATSQHLALQYEVSESSQGVLMGSSVGILKVGDEVERPLSELNNKGFFPVIATVTSSDGQLSFSHQKLFLNPGDNVKTTMKVTAKTPGEYKSSIWIGMFFPFLPAEVLYSLARKSYWLALGVVSLLPGLPVMLYPLLESRLRRRTVKEIRRKTRRMRKAVPF